MPTLACPIPSALNPATANGFMLGITKLPNFTYWCQEANVPGITLPPINTYSPLSVVPVPGDVPSFDDFNVTFLITEDFSNYKAVFDWMIGLGFPERSQQYTSWINKQKGYGDLAKGYSDGFLQVLSPLNNISKTLRFYDMYPTRLEQIQLSTKFSDVVYLAGTVTFAYNYFLIE